MESLERRCLFDVATGDFNGDGFDDLAIGSPQEDLADSEGTANAINAAGAVNVLYGSYDGTTAEGNQVWHLDSPGIDGAPGEFNRLGNALASGDFDNDGFDDLAIGMDGRKLTKGAVLILYGTEDGLIADRSRLITQNTKGIAGKAETQDFFGLSLATGDFDDDGFDDLAVSAPNEDIGGLVDAGAIHILYGGEGRLGKRDDLWHQDSSSVRGIAEAEDQFGRFLTTGDFNDDGHDDLAIGSPREGVDDAIYAGNVQILYGSPSGISAAEDQLFTQAADGENTPEANDYFGYSITAQDFNGDGFDDIATTASNETGVNDSNYIGTVHFLYGSENGASLSPDFIENNSFDLSPLQPLESFAGFVTSGDFDNDGYGDLVIGLFNAIYVNEDQAGRAVVVYGSAAGFDLDGAQTWYQGPNGHLPDEPEAADHLSLGLTTGDLDGNKRDDLILAAPSEGFGQSNQIQQAGGVHVIYGFRSGLIVQSNQFWTQDSPGILEELEDGDYFGGLVDTST